MPPLAPPEALIPEHQRLKDAPVDFSCSSSSSSSFFFSRLWPQRRKFAPFRKKASASSAQDSCFSSKPSNSEQNDAAFASSKRLSTWAFSDHDAQSNASSSCVAERCNVHAENRDLGAQEEGNAHAVNRDLGTQEEGRPDYGGDAESFADWHISVGDFTDPSRKSPRPALLDCAEILNCQKEGYKKEMGLKPITDGLKEVVINRQRVDKVDAGDISGLAPECAHSTRCDDNAIRFEDEGDCRVGAAAEHASDACGMSQECSQITRSDDNAGRVDDEGDRRVGAAEHMLMKRAGSFKAGEATQSACGLKKMRMSTLCELQQVVSSLRFGNSLEERWLAADEMLRLCKGDPIARMTLGVQLGAIPPLISILHSPYSKHQCTALLALLNLAVGNDVNKAAIVKAKCLPRMVLLLQSRHVEVQAAAVTLFLSLSALDANKAEIGASGSIPLLVALTQKDCTKKDALRALYNLSIHVSNIKSVVEAGSVPLLLDIVSNTDMADKSLATLSNLVGMDAGRFAVGEHGKVAYAVLIDVMRQQTDMPKCQEKAVYVLMMIAHYSPVQREAMAAAGVIPALVELSLLGSALAQKRATRTLDSFRRAKAFSAPQQRQCLQSDMVSVDGPQSMTRALSERKVVDGLVQQSLQRTMQRIARRANLSMVIGDSFSSTDTPTALRSFRRSSRGRRGSSCSLPF